MWPTTRGTNFSSDNIVIDIYEYSTVWPQVELLGVSSGSRTAAGGLDFARVGAVDTSPTPRKTCFFFPVYVPVDAFVGLIRMHTLFHGLLGVLGRHACSPLAISSLASEQHPVVLRLQFLPQEAPQSACSFSFAGGATPILARGLGRAAELTCRARTRTGCAAAMV